jgi:hypothetical protein
MLTNIFRSLSMMYNDMPKGVQIIFWVFIAAILLWIIF